MQSRQAGFHSSTLARAMIVVGQKEGEKLGALRVISNPILRHTVNIISQQNVHCVNVRGNIYCTNEVTGASSHLWQTFFFFKFTIVAIMHT